jgi:hypothetical protein
MLLFVASPVCAAKFQISKISLLVLEEIFELSSNSYLNRILDSFEKNIAFMSSTITFLPHVMKIGERIS